MLVSVQALDRGSILRIGHKLLRIDNFHNKKQIEMKAKFQFTLPVEHVIWMWITATTL